jgi:hypothetical protein
MVNRLHFQVKITAGTGDGETVPWGGTGRLSYLSDSLAPRYQSLPRCGRYGTESPPVADPNS